MVFNVVIHPVNMTSAIGKGSVTGLPIKASIGVTLFFDPFCGFAFYYFYEFRHMIYRLKPNEQVEMIGHAVDGNHLVGFVLDDAGDVLV